MNYELHGPAAGEPRRDPPLPWDSDRASDLDRVHLPRLLCWLFDRPALPDHDPWGPPPPEPPDTEPDFEQLFAAHEQLAPNTVRHLAQRLHDEDLAHYNPHGTTSLWASAHQISFRPSISLTAYGSSVAHRIQGELGDHGHRLRLAADHLVRWLWVEHGSDPAPAADFARSSRSHLHGQTPTDKEVAWAITYLTSHQLLEAVPPGRDIRLTPLGHDCAISGETVTTFNNQPKSSGDVYNNHFTTAIGPVIGGRHHAITQTNTTGVNLAEVGQLLQTAALARQLHSVLDLPEPEQAEIADSAQALELEAGSAHPDPGKLRRASDRFMTAVGSATKVTAALTVLAQKGHEAYTAVFGS